MSDCRYGDDTCCCDPNCDDVIAAMGGDICECGATIEDPWTSDLCSGCDAAEARPDHAEPARANPCPEGQ